MWRSSSIPQVLVFIQSINRCVQSLFAKAICINYQQLETDISALKEDDAWPAQPQDAYGMGVNAVVVSHR